MDKDTVRVSAISQGLASEIARNASSHRMEAKEGSMAVYHLMGILVGKRRANAAQVQEVLTQHGCLIKMRLGLHEAGNACSEDGLMVLQLDGPTDEIDELYADLNALSGVKAEHIVLDSTY